MCVYAIISHVQSVVQRETFAGIYYFGIHMYAWLDMRNVGSSYFKQFTFDNYLG